MTTDPHLEADCAWLETQRISKFSDRTNGIWNARIDRLIARAGSGRGEAHPDFLGHLVEHKELDIERAFVPKGAKIMLSRSCTVTPVYSGPQNVTAPASHESGDGAQETAEFKDGLADAVHQGRFPLDRKPTPFSTEDQSGQAYCYRIAASVRRYLALASPAPEGWRGIETAKLRALIENWRKEAAGSDRFADGGGMNREMSREFRDRASNYNSCARQLEEALLPAPPVTIRHEGV